MVLHWGGRGPGHLSRWVKATGGDAPPPLGDPTSPALMWDANQGGCYFPFDTTAMFQTYQGQTNVASNNDPIGLLGDCRFSGGDTFVEMVDAQTDLVDTANTAAAWTPFGSNTVTDNSGVQVTYVSDARGASVPLRASGGLSADLVSGALYRVEYSARIAVAGQLVGSQVTTTTSNIITTINSTTNIPVRNFIVGSNSSNDSIKQSSMGGVEVFTIENIEVKAAPGNHALQSTAALRPVFLSAGYRYYDGTKVLPSTATAGSGVNMTWARVIVPASVPADMFFCGLEGASNTGALSIGVNASGHACAAVGTVTEATIEGTTDIRGLSGVIAVVAEGDGQPVKLYWWEEGASSGSTEYSGTQSGAVSTSAVYYEGARNVNGTPADYLDGHIAESGMIAKTVSADEITNVQRWNNL